MPQLTLTDFVDVVVRAGTPKMTKIRQIKERPEYQPAARLMTYGDIVDAYRVHPEPKSLGPRGEVCGPESIGLLGHRPLELLWVEYIGKESNKFEEVERGSVTDIEEVVERYIDPRHDPFDTTILPILRTMKRRDLLAATGWTPRWLRKVLKGQARPRGRGREVLAEVAGRWGSRRSAPHAPALLSATTRKVRQESW